MRKILLLVICAILTMSVSAQTLSQISAAINKNCPVSFGLSSLDKTSFSNNTFTYYYSYAQGYVNFDSCKARPATCMELGKLHVAEMCKKYNQIYLINRLIEKKINLRIFSIEKYSGKSFSITLSPAQIKEAVRKYASMSPSLLSLHKQVVASNLSCPMQADEVTTLIKLDLTRESLIYDYEIDDSFLNIDDLFNNMKGTYKNEIKAKLKTDISKSIMACHGLLMAVAHWLL